MKLFCDHNDNVNRMEQQNNSVNVSKDNSSFIFSNRKKLTNLLLIVNYDGTNYNGWTGLENSSEVYLNALQNYKNKKKTERQKNIERKKYSTVQNNILDCILKLHGYKYIHNNNNNEHICNSYKVGDTDNYNNAHHNDYNQNNVNGIINNKPFEFIGVSRTDKGVHAKEYICQYISYEKEPPCDGDMEHIKRSLNSLLNKDIKILAVLKSPHDHFNIRFHNSGKIYTYNLDIRNPSQPLERNYAWQLYDDPRFFFLSKKTNKHKKEGTPNSIHNAQQTCTTSGDKNGMKALYIANKKEEDLKYIYDDELSLLFGENYIPNGTYDDENLSDEKQNCLDCENISTNHISSSNDPPNDNICLMCLKTNFDKRTGALGYLNLSYGMGIIFGSFLAGVMVNFVGSRGNLLIALLSQLIALCISTTLEEDPKLLKSSNVDKMKMSEILLSIKNEYIRVLNLFKKTYGICLLILFGLLPILMTKFAFAPVVVDMFKLTPSHTSYLMTYAGIITIIAEGILAPYLSSLLGDMICCKYSIPLTLTGFLLLSLCGANESLVLIFMSIPLCGGALLYICGTSQMTKRVEESELGSIIGLNTSLFYAVTIIAPYIAFKSYIALGLGLYWLLCAFICFVVTFYIFVLDKSTLKIFKDDKDSIETINDPPSFYHKNIKSSYNDISHSMKIINKEKEIRSVIPCDINKIKECAKLFIGHHNFECFRGTLKGTEKLRKINTFCTIHFLDVYELKNNLYQFVIQGDRFLYHMIRIIVGTLVQVGVGLLNVEDVRDALHLCKPLKVKLCAPSQGLCLNKILLQEPLDKLIGSALISN
ncbi:tRNA pseudouridine(38-40) synthase [Plasmodium falciparum Tanzania (2000708)]|uniref:tRNA pseudouridine(38-40) synthase n=2 Tax=Plasmodium falciparum TaxID=5833 RepID=A0A024WDL9_PLAFA|nr:tRNA pseudouridine(38-40) synthase [Plasmodium falciparum Tanzania (2000708)]